MKIKITEHLKELKNLEDVIIRDDNALERKEAYEQLKECWAELFECLENLKKQNLIG